MEKVSDNLLLFSRNLQANGAQFFWDTLYNYEIMKLVYAFELNSFLKHHIPPMAYILPS